MNCKNCNYPLWQLKARVCPECGTPFKPSDFEFVLNSVRFCCPDCGQEYYGTGADGHLDPIEFDCVNCKRHLHMDQMVLRPAEGVDERQTSPSPMPWLERKRIGFFKGWMRTIGRALVMPGRLIESVPEDSSLGSAWVFAVLTYLATMMVLFVPMMVLMAISAAGMGGGMGGGLTMLFEMAVAILVGILVFLFAIFMWANITHGLLKLTGKTAFGIHRTFQVICYSSGANVASGVPCVGGYFGWIWWTISATIMLRAGQRVSGWRAALAGVLPPVLVVGSLVGLYVALIISVMGMASGAVAQISTSGTQTLCTAIIDYAKSEGNGFGPDHALRLIESDSINSYDFMDMSPGMTPSIVNGADIMDIETFSDDRRLAAIQTVADTLPDDVIAHRLGGYVFTYHGIDITNADPGLWIVIAQSDQQAMQAFGNIPISITVGRVDGTTRTYSPEAFPLALKKQNELRAKAGLPPLPDPAKVTSDNPAVEDTGGEEGD